MSFYNSLDYKLKEANLMIKGSFGNLGKALSLFLAVLILAVPVLAQQTSTQQAAIEADNLAKKNVNKFLWFGIGFLLNFVGPAVGYLLAPAPPQTALVGKSPEYVAAFTDAYQRKAKSIQGTYGLYGCLVNTAVWVALYALVFAAATTTPYYWY